MSAISQINLSAPYLVFTGNINSPTHSKIGLPCVKSVIDSRDAS